MTEQQFNKLPSFARNEISKLRADKESLARRCAVIEGVEKSSVMLRLGHKDERPIPDDAAVRFTLANGQELTVGFARNHGGKNYLAIRKESGSTYDLLCTIPQVSNEVYVAVLSETEDAQ